LRPVRHDLAVLDFHVEPADLSHARSQELVVEKQTTLERHVTARKAREMWQATQTFEWDAAKNQFPMRPLPDFVETSSTGSARSRAGETQGYRGPATSKQRELCFRRIVSRHRRRLTQ
jgi:hypothetical protein